MKTWFSCLLLVLLLAGCGDSSKPVSPEDMNQEYVHFAANLALEDIIRRGEASPYFYLSSSAVLNPYRMLGTDEVIADFRRDFAAAEDRYYRLRGVGTVIRGTVSHTDKKAREVVFVKEEKEGKVLFTGTLRLSLDQHFYDDTTMPNYEAGTDAIFMCQEYRPIHNFRNETIHKTEIRLIQCKTAEDYYAGFQKAIKASLMDIYAGKVSVNPDLAKNIATLYLTGKALPDNSVCLSGSFLACNENLVTELARKWGDVKVENIGAMLIDPAKTSLRRVEQVRSAPAERPENANLSPSGEKIYDQSPVVKDQKEAVSKVKVPSPNTKTPSRK